MHQYLVESGGLAASYYANKWFSPYGSPYLSKTDEVINFDWGVDQDIIPNVAREYVSVEWVGFLSPVETGGYGFKVEANDGVRLYVGNQVIIDSMTDVPNADVRRNTS
jgi:hypothetical protein